MKKSKKKKVVSSMFEGATFNNSVVVGVAQSGSKVSYLAESSEKTSEKKEMPSPDLIARAILKVQNLFWGNSSYAIPYCVFRDCYIYHGNRSQYEREMAVLPYKALPEYTCTTGVVSSTINDNKYMEKHVDNWKSNNAPERVIKLMEGFKKALIEEMEKE